MTQLCISDPNPDALSHIPGHLSTMDFELGPRLSQIQGTNLSYIKLYTKYKIFVERQYSIGG